MIRLVDAEWVERELDSGQLRVVDPRSPVKYLQGHIRNAINVPVAKAFDADGRLIDDDRLAKWLGAAGVGAAGTVLLYDDYDAQSGSMLAWILEYLGHPNVRFLGVPFARWKAEGREILYRPVTAEPATLSLAARKPHLRASWRELLDAPIEILDVRSPEEYSGSVVVDARGGHIPGAANVPWHGFVNEDELFLTPARLRSLLSRERVPADRPTVVYCRTGPRAAVAFVALQQLDLDVRLYDGSFAEWAQLHELPVEE
jgi:thiosulfate/3-mercaptopyruvate sulfurtransferase